MRDGEWHVPLNEPPPAPASPKLRDYLARDATAAWSFADHLRRGDGEAIVPTLRDAGLHGRDENRGDRAATRPPPNPRGSEGRGQG